MFRLLFTIFILATIVSCNETAEFAKEERQAVSDSVTKTLHNYYADINKRGLLAEFAYLDSSDDFFWIPPGYDSAISYDSVASLIKENAQVFKTVDNSWDSLSVTPVSKDSASYAGKIRMTMVDTAGTSYRGILQETGVMIKRKDGWKLLHGRTASLLTPPKIDY